MAPFRRRWLSFSLRGLLAAVTLICIWFGWNVEQSRRLQEAVAAVSKLKGTVIFENVRSNWSELLYGPSQPVEVNVSGPRNATDATTAQLRRMTGLRCLRMRASFVTDAGVADLGALGRLEILELYSSSITDEGLAHLSSLTRLRKLTITDAGITDGGLSCLAEMQDLEELTLKGLPITSAGLIHLQRLNKLTVLTLTGAHLDGIGIKMLGELKGLKALDLRGSGCSNEGLAALQRSMPNCKIVLPVTARFAAKGRFSDSRRRQRPAKKGADE